MFVFFLNICVAVLPHKGESVHTCTLHVHYMYMYIHRKAVCMWGLCVDMSLAVMISVQ